MKLLEHAVIAGMPVRNRILRSATWEALADAKGYMSEKQYRIYDQLAKNEVGLDLYGLCPRRWGRPAQRRHDGHL